MSYWIHPDAETELGDAAVYYAEHASLAISEAFLVEFECVIEILVGNQGRGPYGEFGFRVYHFRRFPYSLVYEQNPSAGPQIYAVAHQHREPGYWIGRS